MYYARRMAFYLKDQLSVFSTHHARFWASLRVFIANFLETRIQVMQRAAGSWHIVTTFVLPNQQLACIPGSYATCDSMHGIIRCHVRKAHRPPKNLGSPSQKRKTEEWKVTKKVKHLLMPEIWNRQPILQILGTEVSMLRI